MGRETSKGNEVKDETSLRKADAELSILDDDDEDDDN